MPAENDFRLDRPSLLSYPKNSGLPNEALDVNVINSDRLIVNHSDNQSDIFSKIQNQNSPINNVIYLPESVLPPLTSELLFGDLLTVLSPIPLQGDECIISFINAQEHGPDDQIHFKRGVTTGRPYGTNLGTNDKYDKLFRMFFKACPKDNNEDFDPDEIWTQTNGERFVKAAEFKNPDGSSIQMWATPKCFRWCYKHIDGSRKWIAGCNSNYPLGYNRMYWGRDENGFITYFRVENFDSQRDASECLEQTAEFRSDGIILDCQLWDASSTGGIPQINRSDEPDCQYHGSAFSSPSGLEGPVFNNWPNS